jgi:hypothetical protein
MAQNSVQLQKGLSITAFLEDYGTEEQCHDALVKMKWPEGLFALNAAAKIIAGSRIANFSSVTDAITRHLFVSGQFIRVLAHR